MNNIPYTHVMVIVLIQFKCLLFIFQDNQHFPDSCHKRQDWKSDSLLKITLICLLLIKKVCGCTLNKPYLHVSSNPPHTFLEIRKKQFLLTYKFFKTIFPCILWVIRHFVWMKDTSRCILKSTGTIISLSLSLSDSITSVTNVIRKASYVRDLQVTCTSRFDSSMSQL